ncbi:MAG: SIR2 family protein [Deltaproteobacteria bacterium]|nr:SIR2 family protein [Deltaproteobacteria bacterium]MBI3386478.1 SIR2 family protein [Deltaproteobacteria bacterium]
MIAVVGAGPSVPAVGSSAELIDALVGEDPNPRGRKEYLHWLTRVFRLQEEAFETQLAALSRSASLAQNVRAHLKDKYDIRHPTLLTYEILAHLLKHRFIDALVNLNFDELLDQSLYDELTAGEFVRIVSERDCRHVQFDADASDFLPLYIKLHGTASDPETLRFTRDAYYSKRDRIEGGIQKLLDGTDCTLLNVGSSLGSFELNAMLAAPTRLAIFTLSRGGLVKGPNDPTKEVLAERPGKATSFEDLMSSKWSVSASRRGYQGHDLILRGFADVLRQVADKESNGVVQVPSISRHVLVSELLPWQRDLHLRTIEHAEYSRARAILEVAMCAVKGRGLVSIESLVRGRCAFYFDQYAATSPDQHRESWERICASGGLLPDDVAHETYFADPLICRPETVESDVAPTNRSIDLDKLANRLTERLILDDSVVPDDSRVSTITTTLQDLERSSEVEIHARDDQVCAKIFSAPTTLGTITALRAQTHILLKGEFTQLAVIAETGEWLLDPAYTQSFSDKLSRGLDVYLIIAFRQHEEALNAKFGAHLKVRRLDWWRHNRHMTVAYFHDIPTSGIYFARRLRTPSITPVYVADSVDTTILSRTFMRYWLQADPSVSPPGVPSSAIPDRLSELPT